MRSCNGLRELSSSKGYLPLATSTWGEVVRVMARASANAASFPVIVTACTHMTAH